MTFVLDFYIKQAEKHRGVHEDDKNKNLPVHDLRFERGHIHPHTHTHAEQFCFCALNFFNVSSLSSFIT